MAGGTTRKKLPALRGQTPHDRDAMNKRILIISPYDALSHRQWHEGIVREFPELTFEVVTLPPRYFSWRHRGNSLSLAFDPTLAEPYDLVLATSMTDLSALKGMQPKLAGVPTVLYFHENQFAYPPGRSDQGAVERQITSLYSALAADHLVFNSAYNRDTFITGVQTLLARMPDHVPPGIVEKLSENAVVLPVPLDDNLFIMDARKPAEGVSIVWNHRWEYDKGLSQLHDIATSLLDTEIDFTLHLIGQQFREVPEMITTVMELLRHHGRLGETGFIPSRAEYLSLLARSHVVLSTALHEFQGLAVLEAVATGCSPVVPDRLVYPELFPSEFLYKTPDDAVALIGRLAKGVGSSADVSPLAWNTQRPAWYELLIQST